MYDLLIKNGTIVDGSGVSSFKGDVAISGGKIEEVGISISEGLAKEVIDAGGHIVSPGFIDIHSHSDVNFLHDNRCESKLFQGVTSEVMGQCGSSVYPCPPENRQRIEHYAGGKISDFASCSLSEFAEKIQKENKLMGTNLLPLTGHGTLRTGVMGTDDREACEDEIKLMRSLLERDMRDGSWGLSLGLGYVPGVSSNIDELCALGEIVAPYDGIITSHMRNQSTGTPESLAEMYEIYNRTNAHVHIAHFKASGKAAWGKGPEFVQNVADARQRGVNVTVDVYPYIASSSGITNSFPKWAVKGGRQATLDIINGSNRQKLLKDLEESFASPEDGKGLVVVSTNDKLHEADGKNLFELSQIWGISQAEAAIKVAEETKCSASCISFSMCDADVDYMLSQENYSIGSDGRALPFAPELNQGKPHPRNFGTFPRFLRLVRERNLCTLEMAVRRITGLSADIMGIKDRGYIRKSMIADITIFDYAQVTDYATFENPFQKPEGIKAVIINGKVALNGGVQTNDRLGKLILKTR